MASHVAELAGVERTNSPTALQRGRGNDQVVRADHLAGGGELCPDSRVGAGHPGIHRHDFQTPKKLLDPSPPPPGASGIQLDFHAEPKFAQGDGTNGYGFRGPRVQPSRQVEAFAFVGD